MRRFAAIGKEGGLFNPNPELEVAAGTEVFLTVMQSAKVLGCHRRVSQVIERAQTKRFRGPMRAVSNAAAAALRCTVRIVQSQGFVVT